jgi:hypothetical protein
MHRQCRGQDGKFHRDDIATWNKEIADLTGIDDARLDTNGARVCRMRLEMSFDIR